MGKLVKRRWLATRAGIDIPRRDRKSGSYEAFVPDRLTGRIFAFSSSSAADLAEAEAAVARLDERVSALVNTEALARLLLRAESVASSRIEGLEVSPQRLLRAAAVENESLPAADATAREVLANIDAVAFALSQDGPITVERLLAVHRRLLEPTRLASHAGQLRAEQNWIGGGAYTPFGAAFVPPPAEYVGELLEDLCTFCNDDQLPAVAQAAIAHAQFETIHPFVDGNGRTGRALISMVLRLRGLTRRVTPPISLVLATRAREYVGGLQSTRFVGAPTEPAAIDAIDRWVGFFAACTRRAIADAEAFELRTASLMDDWRARTSDLRSDAAALALLEKLPASPLVTVRDVQAMLGRSFSVANNAVETLVARGILSPATLARRGRAFEAREVIDAFVALERQLASPEGDTRISKPSRRVAQRPKRSIDQARS